MEKQFRFQYNGKRNLLDFERIIGFINPKHKKKFDEFIRYDEEYALINFGKVKRISDPKYIFINNSFKERMAAPGIEPGTPSS